MAKALSVSMAFALSCSPIRQIPAPDPVQSTRPPTNARAHYLRGQVLLASGQLEAASSAFERARFFDPDAPQIVEALSDVALNLGDTAGARQHLMTATQMALDDATVWARYGRLELAFGDREVGRSALERAHTLGADWSIRAALIGEDLRDGGASVLLDTWEVDGPEEQRRRGDLRLAAGDGSGALDDLLAVLPESGRDLSLVTPIVHSAVRASRVSDALLAMDDVCAAQPGASSAWMVAGLLGSLIGDAHGTIESLETAEALGVSLGQGPASALEKARASVSETSPSSLSRPPLLDDPVSRAMRLMDQGAWMEAEASLTASLVDHPEDARLRYMLSELHFKRDNLEAALVELEKVLAARPSFAPGLNLWAWIHAMEGRALSEAEQRALAALRTQPRVGSYWDTLGWIMHLKGDHPRACIILKRALRLSPKDDTVRAHLAECEGEESL